MNKIKQFEILRFDPDSGKMTWIWPKFSAILGLKPQSQNISKVSRPKVAGLKRAVRFRLKLRRFFTVFSGTVDALVALNFLTTCKNKN